MYPCNEPPPFHIHQSSSEETYWHWWPAITWIYKYRHGGITGTWKRCQLNSENNASDLTPIEAHICQPMFNKLTEYIVHKWWSNIQCIQRTGVLQKRLKSETIGQTIQLIILNQKVCLDAERRDYWGLTEYSGQYDTKLYVTDINVFVHYDILNIHFI